MFGLYRFVLSLLVVVNHLLALPILGHYAVHGFFILSGYLMTLVMVNTYGYSIRGIGRFCLNRILRLYPAHWFILALSVFIIFFFGEDNSIKYREFMFIPNNLSQWAQNATLIYWSTFPTSVLPRVSPPTWALTVEITFYALIALGLSRSRTITTLWFSLSIGYMLTTHILGLGYGYRYGYIFSGTLAFSLGAMIFHHRNLLEIVISRYRRTTLLWATIGLAFLNSVVALKFGGDGTTGSTATLCFYVNYALNAALIVLLINTIAPAGLKLIDKTLGDFSYPLYLMHWQVGFACSMLIFGTPISGSSVPGILNFFVTLFVSLACCHLIVKTIEKPVQRVRWRVKSTRIEAPAQEQARGI
ncbi:acyltransferase family protein [Pseudomonas nitroreducens]|uniref:acyltransferase family protein n=1 Tax=Pseudomonas TaxID=286 RepID=UPI000375953D|nr:acyltransferase [Pseudomonas nitroreducens]